MTQQAYERPAWFQAVPGFKWYDMDGDLCIYLGVGGYEETDVIVLRGYDQQGNDHEVRQLVPVIHPTTCEVFARIYKNRWHMSNLRDAEIESDWNWNEQKPYTEEF